MCSLYSGTIRSNEHEILNSILILSIAHIILFAMQKEKEKSITLEGGSEPYRVHYKTVKNEEISIKIMVVHLANDRIM